MTELAKDVTAIDVTDLLTRYSFDLGGYTVEQLVDAWLHHYPIQWVRLAVIEALYQGRYKAFSVEQILNLWKRRGKSLYRFNHEFERIICGRFSSSSMTLPRFYNSPPRSQARSATHITHRPIENQSAQRVEPVLPACPIDSEPQPDERLVNPSPEPSSEAEPTPAALTESVDANDSRSLAPDAFPTNPPATLPSNPPKGVPVPTFKPDDRLELEPLVTFSAARLPAHRQPIHQFVPAPEFSDFHAKLKLVAQGTAADADGASLS